MSTDHEERLSRPMTINLKEAVGISQIDTNKGKYLSIQSDLEPKSAASSVRTDVTSASESAYYRQEELGKPFSWATSPGYRQRSVSRSSMASCRTDETPLTPVSTLDDGFVLSRSPEPSHVEAELAKLENPQPMFPIPLRPKHKSNRQSWDSALGSEFSGRRFRHSPSASLSGTSDYSSIRSLMLETRSPTPLAESDESDESDEPVRLVDIEEEESPIDSIPPAAEESDSDETVSNEVTPAEDATTRILTYSLDVAFGLSANDISPVPTACRSIVKNFISDLAWAVEHDIGQRQVPTYASGGVNRLPTNASTSSTATGSSQRSSTHRDRGKRKSRSGNDNDEDGDDECDDDAKKRGEPGPSKRPKLEASFRMSCPYRKKNPLRFNVRDHRLCALTVFTDTAELRRHIQDWHSRPAPSPHQCPRCQSHYSTREDFDAHLRSTERCPLVESSLGSYDPEDGIDDTIKERIRSKKGRVSDSVEVQWQKIWELLFPDTAVQPYHYCAVMEHFELHSKYRASLPDLRASLDAIGLGHRGLDSLATILNNHFIGLFEQCNEEGRCKDYRNRQPKPPQSQLRPKRRSLRERLATAQRDSGVDVGMDEEGADESPLGKAGPSDGTPFLDAGVGDGMAGQGAGLDEQVGYAGLDGFQGIDPMVFVDGFQGGMPGGMDTCEAGFDGGYARQHPSELRARSGVGGGGLSVHDFRYGGSGLQDGAGRGHWDLDSAILGMPGSGSDLNAWMFGQQAGQR